MLSPEEKYQPIKTYSAEEAYENLLKSKKKKRENEEKH